MTDETGIASISASVQIGPINYALTLPLSNQDRKGAMVTMVLTATQGTEGSGVSTLTGRVEEMESVRTDGALVDLSHPIVEGMTTYPGLPAPEITTFLSREESSERLKSGVSFHIGRLCLVANSGTYLDAPFHYHVDGADVAALPLAPRH